MTSKLHLDKTPCFAHSSENSYSSFSRVWYCVISAKKNILSVYKICTSTLNAVESYVPITNNSIAFASMVKITI